MTTTGIILAGLAQLLHDNDIGAWRPHGAYAPDEIAIVLGDLPQSPEKAVGISDYPVSSDPKLSDTIIGVQARIRGDLHPGTVRDLRDAVYDAWHALSHFELVSEAGNILVTQVNWQSAAPLGPAEGGQFQRSENYYVWFNRPHARLE